MATDRDLCNSKTVPKERSLRLGNSDSEFTLFKEIKDSSGVIATNCISTIHELNAKIGSLQHSLDDFTYKDNLKLLYDKDQQDLGILTDLQGTNLVEVNRNAANSYSVHTIFSKEQIGESKPNVHSPSKKKFENGIEKVKSSITTSSKKPMLVELHSFPGYVSSVVTPLPADLNALFILKTVTEALVDLEYKVSGLPFNIYAELINLTTSLLETFYKETFVKFFQSQLSQDLLQDIFWWFFCHKYQSSANDEKLFHRMATNYTNLLFKWTGNKYHDILFKDYSGLMAQATYCTFCHAFPTSYRQFNSDFRDELLATVTCWMMGSKPAPQCWKSWNFTDLEPTDLRKGEKIHEEAAKAKGFEIDFKQVEDLSRMNNSRRTSRRLSVIPLRTRRQSVAPNANKSNLLNVNQLKLLNGNQSKQLYANQSKLNIPIHEAIPNIRNTEPVSHKTLKVPNVFPITVQETTQKKEFGNVNNKQIKKTTLNVPKNKKTLESSKADKTKEKSSKSKETMLKQISSVLGMTEKKQKKSSCAVGAGPQFSKVVFDIYGRSPLVEHFLLSNNLLKDSGISIYIQRTEVSKLPLLSSETYEDIVRKVKRLSSANKEKYLKQSKVHSRERQKCAAHRKATDQLFTRCSAKLLSNSQDVKNISDLLRLPGKEETEDVEIRSAKLRYMIEHALEECQ